MVKLIYFFRFYTSTKKPKMTEYQKLINNGKVLKAKIEELKNENDEINKIYEELPTHLYLMMKHWKKIVSYYDRKTKYENDLEQIDIDIDEHKKLHYLLQIQQEEERKQKCYYLSKISIA